MEILESQNVTKAFVPKFDAESDQDYSQTDEELVYNNCVIIGTKNVHVKCPRKLRA